MTTLALHNRAQSFLQVMLGRLMIISACFAVAMWIGMDNSLGNACDAMEEAMADLLGDIMCPHQCQLSTAPS